MKRGIQIISKEEMKIKDYREEVTKEDRHATFMKKALADLQIIPQIDGFSPWLWGKACSEAGLMTLSLDDFNVLFLPEMIDKKQCDWFYENQKMLTKLERLSVLYCYQDQLSNFYFLSLEDLDRGVMMEELCNLIEEKWELYQNSKKEGAKVCMKVLK